MKEANIYEEYSLRLKKYFLFLTHNNELAEDLVQETFYQAYKSIDRYDGSCKMITWLYQIGKHCYCDYLKKAKHYSTIGIEELTQEPCSPYNIEDDFIKKEFYNAVLKTVDTLSSPYCDIIKLRIFEEISYKEIGEIYNKSETWARVTFFRAKQKLTERLSENGYTL